MVSGTNAIATNAIATNIDFDINTAVVGDGVAVIGTNAIATNAIATNIDFDINTAVVGDGVAVIGINAEERRVFVDIDRAVLSDNNSVSTRARERLAAVGPGLGLVDRDGRGADLKSAGQQQG